MICHFFKNYFGHRNCLIIAPVALLEDAFIISHLHLADHILQYEVEVPYVLQHGILLSEHYTILVIICQPGFGPVHWTCPNYLLIEDEEFVMLQGLTASKFRDLFLRWIWKEDLDTAVLVE